MAILTKNQLSASNASSFPDNTTGAITPQVLRDFNTGVIDTLVDSLNTGSYAITTGSNDFTQANSFTSISASSFVSASGFAGDGSRLTNITSSIALPILDEGIPVGNATSMNFTGSNISAIVVGGVAVVQVVNQNTGSLLTTASFNQYTASNDSKVNQLISATASYAISSSVAAVDAAQQAQINSLIASTSSFALTSLNAFTASQETKDATLGLYTASVDQQFSNIGAQSSSWDNTNLNSFTSSQNTKNVTLATYTASVDQKFSNIGSQSGSWVTESETASFARTNVTNVFTAAQTFTSISASSNIKGTYFQGGTAYVDLIQTQIPPNPGDLTIFIPNGNLLVTSSISVTGAVTASFFKGDGSQLTNLPGAVPLTSLNAFTQSQDTKNSTLATYTASVNSSLTNINTFTASNGNTSLNSYTASNDTKWSNLAGQTGSYVTSVITASSLVTASAAGNTITFTKGDASTFAVSVSSTPIDTGSLLTTASFNAYTSSNDQRVSSLETNSASVNISISNINTATASLFTSTSLSLITASFNTGTRNLTFTKGDTSTFSVNIPDVSGSTSGFATLGANTFTGSQTISSSLNVSGSANFVGGDVNFTDQGRNINIDVDRTIIKGQKPTLISSSLDIQGSLTASLSNGYAWVGNATNHNVLVATSSFATNVSNLATTGSNSFVGNQTITGSLILSSSAAVELQVIGNSEFTGSVNGNVVSMSVTSNTASMDFSLGNYFELSASVSPIRIEVTNLKGGTTKTLALNGVTSSTINFSSNVLQPSGSAYTASVSGSNDILSFVAFNSNRVNVVSTLKMI